MEVFLWFEVEVVEEVVMEEFREEVGVVFVKFVVLVVVAFEDAKEEVEGFEKE